MRILVVDDHLDLIANIFAVFEQDHYLLDVARDAHSALELCQNNHYDILILDWMLPKISGIELLRKIREEYIFTPVIMLTAKSDLEDKLEGFSAGADDYLTKPFSTRELRARVKALHARSMGKNAIVKISDLSYNLHTDEVIRNNVHIKLNPIEKKLLVLLMRESPKIVTRERLEFTIWRDNLPNKDLLRTHIYELRKKIDSNYDIKLIKTCHKLGYQICSMVNGND